MKVLICGSRHVEDTVDNMLVVEEAMTLYCPNINEVIHGGAAGIDDIAGQIATGRELKVTCFAANWGKYGKAAGPIRNQQMIDQKPDLVLAFIGPKSKGTKDTIQRAKRAGIETVVIELLPKEAKA